MKIKVKDLTDELVDALNYYKEDCCDLCLSCSFFDENLNFLDHPCVCMFIKTLRIQKDLKNYEIDLESMLNQQYDNVFDLCKVLKIDPKVIDELRETIERKESVKNSLKNIYEFLKNINEKVPENILKDYYNVVEYLENEI